MKVSITFDKEVKQSSKQQWVREIQSVVDRLNNKPKLEEERPDKAPLQPTHRRQGSEEVGQDSRLLGELVAMQKIMEQRFSAISRSVGRLAQKMASVQNRLTAIQKKQEERDCQSQDFDREFAQIALKYEKISKQPSLSKKIMGSTADTTFLTPGRPDLESSEYWA